MEKFLTMACNGCSSSAFLSLGQNAEFVTTNRYVPSHHTIKLRIRAAAAATEETPSKSEVGSQENGGNITKEAAAAPAKKPAGSGFGSSTRGGGKTSSKKGSKDKAAAAGRGSSPSEGIARRPAPEKSLISAADADPKAQQIETAFVLSLVGLLVLVLVEGLALAATGFLPEEWDSFFVKFVYPSFTPTVGLFVASAAGYGLYKYLGSGSRNKI